MTMRSSGAEENMNMEVTDTYRRSQGRPFHISVYQTFEEVDYTGKLSRWPHGKAKIPFHEAVDPWKVKDLWILPEDVLVLTLRIFLDLAELEDADELRLYVGQSSDNCEAGEKYLIGVDISQYDADRVAALCQRLNIATATGEVIRGAMNYVRHRRMEDFLIP